MWAPVTFISFSALSVAARRDCRFAILATASASRSAARQPPTARSAEFPWRCQLSVRPQPLIVLIENGLHLHDHWRIELEAACMQEFLTRRLVAAVEQGLGPWPDPSSPTPGYR